MQAVVITRYGGPEVMALTERPAPAVGPRDVLIAVRAASLNPIDYKLRQGKAKVVLTPSFPIGLGCDVAGVVIAVGPAVTRCAVGDAVFARLEKDRMGGLAHQVAADEAVVARRPAAGSWGEAAAIPLAGLTALQALREVAQVQPGQRVLIQAGAGGVGTLAIQIAKHLGAWVATTTSGKNAQLVRSLGADQVIDYTQGPAGAQVGDLDVVLDTLGAGSEPASLAMCRPGGVVVGLSGMPDAAFAQAHLPAALRPVVWLATRGRRRAAARSGATFRYLFMRPDGAMLAELAAWVDAGVVRPIIHRSFPLAQFRDAFAELEGGHARGKIVVTVP
ncbi:MAG: NADP-dependent oxidoreductase [Kofleriaceae bacterium]